MAYVAVALPIVELGCAGRSDSLRLNWPEVTFANGMVRFERTVAFGTAITSASTVLIEVSAVHVGADLSLGSTRTHMHAVASYELESQ